MLLSDDAQAAAGDIATDAAMSSVSGDAPTVAVAQYTESHNYESIFFLRFNRRRLEVRPHAAIRSVQKGFAEGKPPWQALVAAGSCLCTASIVPRFGVSLAQAIVTTLTNFAVPQLGAAAAVGAYSAMSSAKYQPSLAWSALIAGVIAPLWLMCNHYKVLSGWGGRLGTMSFGVSNLLVPLVAASEPSLELSASVYWDGASAAEASGGGGGGGWTELTPEVALMIVVVVASSALLTKLARESGSSSLRNPVAAGSAVALGLMIITAALCGQGGERDLVMERIISGGIGQGSFTGMAGDGVLRSRRAFFIAGLIGGGLNLLLHPFARGFGGKQGFLALLSCATFRGAELLRRKIVSGLLLRDQQRALRAKEADGAGGVRMVVVAEAANAA